MAVSLRLETSMDCPATNRAIQRLREYPSVGAFVRLFPTETACQRFLLDGRLRVGCEQCGSRDIVPKRRSTWRCRDCRREISPRTGTLFSYSKVPLRNWFAYLYFLCSPSGPPHPAGLARILCVERHALRRVINRTRHHMAGQIYRGQIGGEGEIVQIDEVLISSRRRSSNQVRQCFLGLQDRNIVRTIPVPDRTAATLVPLIKQHIAPHSIIFSDDWRGYASLRRRGLRHYRCNHARGFFPGEAGANTCRLDAYWGRLKLFIKTHARASTAPSLQAAVAQYSVLYNNRHNRVRLLLNTLTGRNQRALR